MMTETGIKQILGRLKPHRSITKWMVLLAILSGFTFAVMHRVWQPIRAWEVFVKAVVDRDVKTAESLVDNKSLSIKYDAQNNIWSYVIMRPTKPTVIYAIDISGENREGEVLGSHALYRDSKFDWIYGRCRIGRKDSTAFGHLVIRHGKIGFVSDIMELDQ